MSALKLFINTDADSPRSALIAAFDSTQSASDPVFVRYDARIVELHFLKVSSDPTRPWRYITEDPTDWDLVRLGIGTEDLPVDSGTFTLTDPVASETTAAIAVDADAATVQAAVQAGWPTNYANATVSINDDGSWTLDRVDTGDIATPSGNTAAVSPSGSTLQILKTETGTADLSTKFSIQLVAPSAAAVESGWTALPAASIVPTVAQAGSGTQNKIFQVEYNADAVGGRVSFTFTGDTVARTVGWAYDADEATVLEAFETHPDVESGGVSVTKVEAGFYLIECTGAGISLSDTPALALNSAASTLLVPVGLTATLRFNRAGVLTLLRASNPAETLIEVEIQRSTGDAETLVQQSCTLYKDLIVNNPGVSSALQTFPTIAQIEGAVRSYPAMAMAGELQDEMLFGFFRPDVDCEILGAMLYCQTAPTGAAVTVDLAVGGVEQTKISTLADGASTARTIFGSALSVTAGQEIQAKTKQIGSTFPGEMLTVLLIVKPIIS